MKATVSRWTRWGSAYVTGQTFSNDFSREARRLQAKPAAGSATDAFVAKLKPDGSGLLYSTYLGGDSYDLGHGIRSAGLRAGSFP